MVEDATLIELVNEHRRVVDVQSSNFSVRELVRMVVEGELSIAPEYQRLFRWSTASESRLIESLMLGLPVPAVYVATNADFTLEVVDGLQRLSTLVHFLAPSDEALEGIKKDAPLVLESLETIPELNGRGFADLPRDLQLYFGRTTLQVTALTDKSDDEVRFELFDRLNAGSLKLTNQEVRNAVYRGPLVSFLRDMADLAAFRSLLVRSEDSMRDGTPEETVLKFFAYRHARSEYKGPIKPFLNAFMKTHREIFPQDEWEAEFRGAVRVLREALDGDTYLREGHHWTPMVPFEAALIAAADLAQRDESPSPQEGWKEDGELRAVSGGGSNTPGKLDTRILRMIELLEGASPTPA